MHNVWALASLWVGLALSATLLAIWFKISAALTEIVVGTAAQLVIGAVVGPTGLAAQNEWITFLAGTGAIVLTFLAGAELVLPGPRQRRACGRPRRFFCNRFEPLFSLDLLERIEVGTHSARQIQHKRLTRPVKYHLLSPPKEREGCLAGRRPTVQRSPPQEA